MSDNKVRLNKGTVRIQDLRLDGEGKGENI